MSQIEYTPILRRKMKSIKSIPAIATLLLLTSTIHAQLSYTVLDAFDYNDGLGCTSSTLFAGRDGAFYGMRSYCGSGGVSPPSFGSFFRIDLAGMLTTVHSFNGSDGSVGLVNYAGWSPLLVQGSDSNLYGATSAGGLGSDGSTGTGYGTIFRMATNGALTTVYSFTGASDGSFPYNIITGSDGNFYGLTSFGGIDCCAFTDSTGMQRSGRGTIFKITPAGVVSTVGGNGSAGHSGDTGPATFAQLNGPVGVALDGNGNRV